MPPPYIHHGTHSAVGSDPLPIDTLVAPTDNTLLNASTSAHGLLPKGTNTGVNFLRDDVAFTPLATQGTSHIYYLEHFLQLAPQPASGTNIQQYGGLLYIDCSNPSGTGPYAFVTTTHLAGKIGVLQLAPSTTASSYSRAFANIYFLDSFTLTLRSICNPVNAISSATTQHWFGLTNSPGPVIAATDFRVGFYFEPAISPNWRAYTIKGTSPAETTIDTGVAAVGVWADLKLVVTVSQALYYINGNLVATITTNIPASTVPMHPTISIASNADTADYSLYVDTFEMDIDTGVPGTLMRAYI